jgi:hypothetical protein
MKWVGQVAHMVETRSAYKILVGKSEIKKTIGKVGLDGRIILGKYGSSRNV